MSRRHHLYGIFKEKSLGGCSSHHIGYTPAAAIGSPTARILALFFICPSPTTKRASLHTRVYLDCQSICTKRHKLLRIGGRYSVDSFRPQRCGPFSDVQGKRFHKASESAWDSSYAVRASSAVSSSDSSWKPVRMIVMRSFPWHAEITNLFTASNSLSVTGR